MMETVKCPICAGEIRSNAIFCRHCRRGLSLIYFKPCPFCAELIRRHARKCRYCYKDVEPESGADSQCAPVPRPIIPSGMDNSTVLDKPHPEKTNCDDKHEGKLKRRANVSKSKGQE